MMQIEVHASNINTSYNIVTIALEFISCLYGTTQNKHPNYNLLQSKAGRYMIFYVVYILSIIVLILHFTGWLLRRNMEWAVLVAAVALFSVNILDYMKII